MKALELWRLHDTLSINEAALLAVGVDPSSSIGASCRARLSCERPEGYDAMSKGIGNALRNGTINGIWNPIWQCDSYGNRREPIDDSMDNDDSTVEVASLKAWLAGRDQRPVFFFPIEVATPVIRIEADIPGYLDEKNPRYSRKLAAAVRAWEAVTDPGTKSAKQALEAWLRTHAAHFELVDTDGNPINAAMTECSTVANWNPGGGAPKTPGG